MRDGTYGRFGLADAGEVVAAPAGTRVAALAGGCVAYATDTALHAAGERTAGELRPVAVLDRAPVTVAVSSSGRYVLAELRSPSRAVLVDLADGRVSDYVGEQRPSSPVVAAFATVGDDEVLLLSRRLYRLQVLGLPDGRHIRECDYLRPSSLIFNELRPLLDGAFVAAIGHGWAEGKDSLVTISLPELLADPAAAGTEFGRRRFPHDYVDVFAVGPCGAGALVAYRYDEDDDDQDDDEDDGDVDHLRGFYVRSLPDGRLLETIPYDGPVGTGAPLFATDEAIVVGGEGEVVVVPRAAGATAAPLHLEAPVHALDPATRRILLVAPNGTPTVLRLGSPPPG